MLDKSETFYNSLTVLSACDLNLCLDLQSLHRESIHTVCSGHSSSSLRSYNKVKDSYDVNESILFTSVLHPSGVAPCGHITFAQGTDGVLRQRQLVLHSDLIYMAGDPKHSFNKTHRSTAYPDIVKILPNQKPCWYLVTFLIVILAWSRNHSTRYNKQLASIKCLLLTTSYRQTSAAPVLGQIFLESCLSISVVCIGSISPNIRWFASAILVHAVFDWKLGLVYTRPLTRDLIDGRKERVQFDKITARVSRLCYGLDAEHVDAAAITQKVISGVYQGVTTVELDNLVSMPIV